MEREKRERRNKNLVFKRIKEEDSKIKDGVEKICKEIGVEVGIEKIRKIRTGLEERGGMVIITIRTEEEKRTNRGLEGYMNKEGYDV